MCIEGQFLTTNPEMTLTGVFGYIHIYMLYQKPNRVHWVWINVIGSVLTCTC